MNRINNRALTLLLGIIVGFFIIGIIIVALTMWGMEQ